MRAASRISSAAKPKLLISLGADEVDYASFARHDSKSMSAIMATRARTPPT
jgi:hypothetical protein